MGREGGGKRRPAIIALPRLDLPARRVGYNAPHLNRKRAGSYAGSDQLGARSEQLLLQGVPGAGFSQGGAHFHFFQKPEKLGGVGGGLEYKLTSRISARASGDVILQSFSVTGNSAQLGYSPHETRNARATIGAVYHF